MCSGCNIDPEKHYLNEERQRLAKERLEKQEQQSQELNSILEIEDEEEYLKRMAEYLENK